MHPAVSSGLQPAHCALPGRIRGWLLARFGCLGRDEGGATAIEFAVISGLLVLLLLNGVDLGRYIYLRGQVENATQAGAHSVWERCDPMKLPVMTKCYADQTAAKRAVVDVISGIVEGVASNSVTLVDGYFCPDSSGALHSVTNVTSLPAQCLSGVVPGNYVQVQVNYSFVPLFGNLTVAAAFGTSISTTSYMRLQ